EFWPDAVSTDMHTLTCEGPGYDLPTVMSKLLHVGMPLEEVIRASTVNAAAAIGWQDRVGTLGVGREADVAVLALNEVDVELEDCQGQTRRLSRRLEAEAVWRAGEPAAITRPEQWPNPGNAEKARAGWPQLLIRDDTPP
ncbi:MAG: amidohydrolase family protein, partial [Gemmatimonadetes bacterium]|nr:amidohydrolase family protein [Gemmatimonadota bacterium]